MSAHALSRLAAMLAALGIILGASGAHGSLHDVLVTRESLKTWETAVLYHLVHAVALWAIGAIGAVGTAGATRGMGATGVKLENRAPLGAWFLIAGLLLFSGSLYILSLARVPWLGPITPLGGLALILGWLVLAARPQPNGASS